MNDLENMSADELKKLAQKKQQQEKKKAKEEESAEDYEIRRWNSFINAERVMAATDMKFYRDSAPKYFRSLTTTLSDKKTGVEMYNTEIKFYPPSSLRENWIELDDELSRKIFRIMVEGGEISVKNPETGQWETHQYSPRVFDKITNTLKTVDEKTYNLLRLDDKLKPNYGTEDTPVISSYMRALVNAISGNNITWNEKMQDWVGDKEENRVWFEKWCYGAVHADIGNPTASLPVIFGKGKVGKNAMFDIVFKQILGKESCFSSTWDVLHGNFDGFKMNKVVMFIDEVPARNDWSAFKNMTGSPDSFVKMKYGAEFTIENTIRYVIGCNEETYPLPVEDGPQMMRVSPIKTQRNNTFAENFVKITNQEQNDENYCRNLLAELDPKLDVDELSNFEIGDMLLRGALHNEWASREAAQEFLNYLDYTYRSDNGFYNNPPLRGADWAEVIEEKESTVNKIVQYIIEEQIEQISNKELYEIYKVLQEDRSDTKMKFNGFAAKIKPLLLETGLYKFLRNATVKDGSRVSLFVRLESTDDFKEYEIDSNKFIVEVDMYKGTGAWQKKTPMLKYKKNKSNKEHYDLNRIMNWINPEKD